MPGGKEVKIIAVTASAMDDNRQELMEVGADDFISKPFRRRSCSRRFTPTGGGVRVRRAARGTAAGRKSRPHSPRVPGGLAAKTSSTRCARPSSRRTWTSCWSRIQEVEARDPRCRPGAAAAWPRVSSTRSFSICSARRTPQDRKLTSSPARWGGGGGGPSRPAGILVVDDTPANLQVLAGMLKDRGYKVRPVPGGKLALLAAAARSPDLILLDINMPEMNGYEVCEHLKADDVLKGIPVIFISAPHRASWTR